MLHNIESKDLGPRGEAMADAVGTCVHCGFCLPACPTYQELESEMDSPRGRITLMKSVLEGSLSVEEAEPHVDRCLGCLACVTHCPSGVEYGELLSGYRSHTREDKKSRRGIGTKLRDTLVGLTLPHAKRFRWAMKAGIAFRPLQPLVPTALRPMLGLLPESVPKAESLPSLTKAIGEKRGRVALLAGCAQQVLAPDINMAAIRVLSQNGIEVVVPPKQGCCGALSWHSGEGEVAAKFAADLIKTIGKDVDFLVTTAAGCGSAISEYPLLLAGSEFEEQGRALKDRTVDVSVYLARIGIREEIPEATKPLKVAYHDACHLAHAQNVRSEPRELLSMIPGVELTDLADTDTCCGSAGTYNIEQPEIANQLGSRKASHVVNSGCDMVATGNIGCLVQLTKHLGDSDFQVPVLHTVQVLDRAYRQLLN